MSDEQTTPWKGTIEWVLSLPCVVDEPGARLVYEVMQRLKLQLEQRIAAAVAAERERCVPYDYLRECFGEVLHTAFRKGGQSKEADRIWYTIKDMPRDDWGRVLDWIVWCIRTSRNADAIRARAGEGDIDNPPVV